MKLTKTMVTGSVLALAFLANCDFIMGPDWKYGEAELRDAVEGTWTLKHQGEVITLTAKQATRSEHSARERGFVTSAAACGNRSFVKSASACADSTEMPLEITADGHKISDARLAVYSTEFKQGMFRFSIDGADVNADIDPTGKVQKASLYAPGKDRVTVALERIKKPR